MHAIFSLSLRERVGVRGSCLGLVVCIVQAHLALSLDTSAPNDPLTPALSRKERE